ncbi:MAG TPA: hypothetical protein VE869_01200 [Gemmatimonas sp.]|nr:hypothetical protein [Gemmatimonas sp.]
MDRAVRSSLAMPAFACARWVLAACALAACSGGLTPAPAPAPAPAPGPAAPRAETPAVRATRFRLPLALSSVSYRVELRAELERDSASRRERDVSETSARVALALRRDARGSLRGTGRVDSFTVRASGVSVRPSANVTRSTASVPAPLFTSVAVDATLDSTQLRATVRPALPNECDRPEAAAASIARELLVRVPENVSIGDRWRDSLVTLVCRGAIPMTLRTIVESVADETRDGDRILHVRQSTFSVLEGSSRTPWRQVTVSGTGSGTQDVLIDIARGVVTAIDGGSTLVVTVMNGSLRDASATQTVKQTVVVTVRQTK